MCSPIRPLFLRDVQHGGPVDQAQEVATRLAGFVEAAAHSLDVAIYDFRLSEPLATVVVGAMVDAAERGVPVRVAFDAGNAAMADPAVFAQLHADPAPPGTADWVQRHFAGTPVETKAIAAPTGQLMHSKYLIRDSRQPQATVWTGSANFTDDAWTRQENNTITIASAPVAAGYQADFDQLWTLGTITGTGGGAAGTTTIDGASVGWTFAPADGHAIDAFLTARVGAATTRIMIASMVLTSHPLLAALAAAVARGIPVSGIYDAGQMDPIAAGWAANPHDRTVLANWHAVKAHLVAKHSTPYTPTGPHDFMHNKILIIDDLVTTGSYNLSANAQRNAENHLRLAHPDLTSRYAAYVATIADSYSRH